MKEELSIGHTLGGLEVLCEVSQSREKKNAGDSSVVN